MLFLSVGRGGRRRIEQVWESDGRQPHRVVYEAATAGGPSLLITEPSLTAAKQVIDMLLSSGRRTIEDVRSTILNAWQP